MTLYDQTKMTELEHTNTAQRSIISENKRKTVVFNLATQTPDIGVARGSRGPYPPTFSEHIVILCFKRRYPKQNSVICLKSSILPPSIFYPLPNFWAGYAADPRGVMNHFWKVASKYSHVHSCITFALFEF